MAGEGGPLNLVGVWWPNPRPRSPAAVAGRAGEWLPRGAEVGEGWVGGCSCSKTIVAMAMSMATATDLQMDPWVCTRIVRLLSTGHSCNSWSRCWCLRWLAARSGHPARVTHNVPCVTVGKFHSWFFPRILNFFLSQKHRRFSQFKSYKWCMHVLILYEKPLLQRPPL